MGRTFDKAAKHREELEMAFRRLARACDLVEEQKKRIARLEEHGCQTYESQKVLKLMSQTVASFQRHLRHLRSEGSDRLD